MKQRESLLVLGAILGILIIFIPEIVFFQKGFLGGDYEQQFFPYSVWYAEGLKNFKLPMYTDLIGCGYSLLAEGQTGIFYPLNILLFFIFPVHIAYQLNTLIHFLLGGLFSYLFMRNKGISFWGSLIFSLVFMFGANVCGIRYNTVVQKVFVWFPLGLFCIDRFFSPVAYRYRYIVGLSLIFLLQIFAGFLQVAFYCISFSLLYFIIKIFTERRAHKIKATLILSILMLIVGVISLLQILPTLTLVKASTRAHQDVDFSLWGSSTPFVLCTLVFPHWDYVVEGSLYMGIILLFFLFLFFRYFKEAPRDIRIYFFLFVLSFIFALGKFTPVAPSLIKIFHLYFIRRPSKFLFIANFFFPICAIWGMEHFLKKGFLKKDIRFLYRTWIVYIVIIVIFFIAANVVLNNFREQIIAASRGYVESDVYGKSFHRYSLAIYHSKIETLFGIVREYVSLANRANWVSFLFIVIAPCVLVLRKHFKKVTLAFIMIDLLFFSQHSTGLKGNFYSWREFLKTPAYITFLKNDRTTYRIYNFLTAETRMSFSQNYPLLENANLRYGLSSVGIYAPLVDKDYYDLLHDLGAIDDSLGRLMTTKEQLKNNLGLLASLNVKYILSFTDLSDIEYLHEVYAQDMFKIYQVKDHLPFLFFASKIKRIESKGQMLGLLKSKDYNPREYLLVSANSPLLDRITTPEHYRTGVLKNSDGELTITVEVERLSFLVINRHYKQWKAYLDGREVAIYPVNVILGGIIVPQGKHKLELRFQPYW